MDACMCAHTKLCTTNKHVVIWKCVLVNWVCVLVLACANRSCVLPTCCCADPLKKETNLNAPAIKKWLTVGAQPSDTVKNLLKKAYVIQPDAIKVDMPRVEL
eukprot:GHRQ01026204.1.p1 GENE.GHRQ01026204.1~~GHRQ01026204.1.p1  ORF type:complete len:118 (-),score=8.57 GHRQ01026204.1:528-833(-)